MTPDHHERQRLLTEAQHPNLYTATPADWLAWVNDHYPFAESYRKKLVERARRPAPGSSHELLDLCGIADRAQAADLARTWFWLGTREYEQAFEKNERWKRDQSERERQAREQLANHDNGKPHKSGVNPGDWG